ncbi:MAG: cation:proton antiporter [Alteromonadaceae bacterium]|nr:MAG: cation:proton antiporter [Alteromonadaceae bacterium]
MLNHLPILQVILPLLAAPTCLLLKEARLAWAFTTACCMATLAISVMLLLQVIDSGVIVYSLGGWQAPIGIEYRIDSLNAFVMVLVSGLSSAVILAARESVAKEVGADKQVLFYIAYLLCFAGLLGICATGDAFNVFVFLEISSLSAYTLIALGSDRRALWAAYQYLIMGTIGATFILIGIGMIYMMTGTLNMHDLAERLPEAAHTKTVFTAFTFIIIGTCLKLALFPLHLWLPNAYAYSPSIVSAFMAATATKVAVYVLIRFVFSVFGVDFSIDHMPLQQILLVLSLIGIVWVSIVAIYQTNLKKLLAYSSVAQIGYIILGFSVGTVLGLQASLIHLFNHALMKGALFLAIAGVVYRIGGCEFSQLSGIGKKMPWTMAAVVVGGLSLIGVPLTTGFVSKWYLVSALIEAGWWPAVAVVMLGSLLAVIYVWKVVEVAYFGSPEDGYEGAYEVKEAPLSILIPTWMLAASNIYFGIDTRFTSTIGHLASQTLFGAGS